MSDTNLSQSAILERLLIKHEEFRSKPYCCGTGKTVTCAEGRLTIGIGRNIQDNGITIEEAMYMLRHDIERARSELQPLALFRELDAVRQAVLIDMNFNLGFSRFKQFVKFLSALETRSWKEAANEMLDSKWAGQVGIRAQRLAKMIETGEWPKDI